MAILETFYLLFKSNAPELKKDFDTIDQGAKKTEGTFKDVSKATHSAGTEFERLAHSLQGVIAGTVGAAAILAGFKNAIDYGVQVSRASNALGVNVTDLDAWDNAVQRTGGTAEGFQQSLQGLSQHLGTTGAVALKVLPHLADAFQKLNKPQGQAYGKALGLDEATILLLQQGRREVESVISRQKELGLVTEKDKETFLGFNNTLTDTGHSFRTLFTSLAVDAIPLLTDVLNATIKFTQYLTTHKDIVVGAFTSIGAAIALAFAPILVTYGVVLALIGLFAVLFEDIRRFQKGEQSLIGDLTKKYNIKPLTPEDRQREAEDNENILKGWLGLSAAQQTLTGAANNPVNSLSSNSITNSSAFERNNTINTGPITVNTRATDANGVAKGLFNGINLWQTANQFADGVVA